MKVLIVDDEQHAREAAKLLVPWVSLGFREPLEAENGEYAKQVIEEMQPDIVVTDMHMPVSDGMRLIEWVSEFDPSIKLIVISGYNDFQYVRHALKHGGIDYLLKPIDPAQLLDAVHRALEQLNGEKQERQKQIQQGIAMNQYKPVYRDHLFGQLTQPRIDSDPIIRQLAEQFPAIARASNCHAALFPLHSVMPGLLRRYGNDRDLAVYAVQNVLNDFLVHQWNEGCAFRSPGDPEELIVLLWSEQVHPAIERPEQLIAALKATFKLPFYAGVSGSKPFPSGASDAVDAARQACLHRNLIAPDGSNVWSEDRFDHTGHSASALPDLTALAEPIRLALLGRDEQSLRGLLEQWFGAACKLAVVTPIHLERWQKQLEIASARWQHADSEADASIGLSQHHLVLPFLYDDSGGLSLPETKENWLRLLLEEAGRLARTIRQERSIIRDITDYIERNLQDDLSLQQLAGRFFLSREYVSRRFRQETGVTLSEYVERLRMEHATRLLANRAYKIADIAEMVGYTDEKYFSKVFKKHAGVSPQQFRKNEP